MITIANLWKAFGQQDLFAGAELRVGPRERVCLVGPNGSGKTTLFEMLAGAEPPDRGEARVLKQAQVGYLRQDTGALHGRSLLDEVLSAAGDVTEAAHRLSVLEAELAECPEGPTGSRERDRLIAEYGEIHERFAGLEGYTVEFQAKAILGGLGFDERDFQAQTQTFSGGQLMRIALAKLLLAAPDLLMLDEPTNHLDLDAVEWLERFLRSYGGAVFFVSHDRELINGIATRVVEIDGGRLISYKGDYEAYLEQRELAAQQAEAAERNRARQAADAQEFIDRFRAKATKARQVQSRIKALERAGGPAPQRRVRGTMGLRFPTPPRAARVVVELAGVRFGYGDTPLYDSVDLVLERSQKVALVGPNGAGKTTLLKLMAGVLEPQAGRRSLGHNARPAYFAQQQAESLNPANRILDEVPSRDVLGRFLFSGDVVKKRVGVLSGGERTRLAMAKLLVTPLNALFLDEPTNHLDIQSRDVLEGALLDYEGALVLVTHDRHLIRSVANRIVEVRDGRVTAYEGDYDFYLAKRQEPGAPAPQRTVPATGSAAERRRASAQARAAVRDLRNSLGRIEKELEALSAEIKDISERLADPAVYASGTGVAWLVDDYEAKTGRVKELEAAWEEAAGLLESQGASV